MVMWCWWWWWFWGRKGETNIFCPRKWDDVRQRIQDSIFQIQALLNGVKTEVKTEDEDDTASSNDTINSLLALSSASSPAAAEEHVFCQVPGRLAILNANTKYPVTVGEVCPFFFSFTFPLHLSLKNHFSRFVCRGRSINTIEVPAAIDPTSSGGGGRRPRRRPRHTMPGDTRSPPAQPTMCVGRMAQASRRRGWRGHNGTLSTEAREEKRTVIFEQDDWKIDQGPTAEKKGRKRQERSREFKPQNIQLIFAILAV